MIHPVHKGRPQDPHGISIVPYSIPVDQSRLSWWRLSTSALFGKGCTDHLAWQIGELHEKYPALDSSDIDYAFPSLPQSLVPPLCPAFPLRIVLNRFNFTPFLILSPKLGTHFPAQATQQCNHWLPWPPLGPSHHSKNQDPLPNNLLLLIIYMIIQIISRPPVRLPWHLPSWATQGCSCHGHQPPSLPGYVLGYIYRSTLFLWVSEFLGLILPSINPLISLFILSI